MKFYSTNNRNLVAGLREAVLQGLAPDNGLYMPEYIPRLPDDFFSSIGHRSMQEIAFTVSQSFVDEDVNDESLSGIVARAIKFDAPLVPIGDMIHALELFHGPTMAFKDFGARFMAGLLGHFAQD